MSTLIVFETLLSNNDGFFPKWALTLPPAYVVRWEVIFSVCPPSGGYPSQVPMGGGPDGGPPARYGAPLPGLNRGAGGTPARYGVPPS